MDRNSNNPNDNFAERLRSGALARISLRRKRPSFSTSTAVIFPKSSASESPASHCAPVLT